MTRPPLYADTRLEAEEVLLALLRNAPPARKAQMVEQRNRQMRGLPLAGLRSRHPHADETELFRRMAASLLGETLAAEVYASIPGRGERDHSLTPATMNEEAFEVTLRVVDALETLGVPYLLGGSLAAALYGVPRTTVGSDLVADLDIASALRLAQELAGEFYLSLDAMFEAVEQRSAFNVIHLASAFKVDIFVRKDRAFDRSQLARRLRITLSDEPDRTLYVAAPEDMILARLEWYRMGGETSERQWLDVTEIARVQGDLPDMAYLRRAAAEMGVADLLEKLLS